MALQTHDTKPSKYMGIKETAEQYGVTVKTIERWIKSGKIPSEQPAGPHGRHFILREQR